MVMEVTHDVRISLEQNSISKEACSRSSAYNIEQDTEFEPPLGPLFKNINLKKKENKMVCKCDCPIHSKCDNVNEGKQCVYDANWVDEIKYNPKHW